MSEGTYRPTDRRPLASRNWPVFVRLSRWLAECGASANGISIAGMVSGIAAGGCLAATSLGSEFERPGWLAAALFVQLRLVANLLDGMVAIAAGKASPVGELFNEVPDRVSDAAILVGLGYATGGDPLLGFAAAGMAVFTAYVRAMGKVAGGPQEYCGPMAKQQRMALVTLLGVYSSLAPATWQPRCTWRPDWGLAAAVSMIIIAGGLLTAMRRLRRIARHLRAAKP